ncbi:hypothetical protein AKJ58_01420 [candidate division MSBL1 archaeon SCGC-AAA385D11]|uniref:Uncharacterized protein n=1 Tax=candidate division MSBL1 archaeon SCGC-AAA385D11 TaxID=1698286 RepID=A0A133VNB2_9EURY|nr:hypothetical protein AKJ58_01420 [candidate division MSBL1 archaeon SCGC-AAA385D11]
MNLKKIADGLYIGGDKTPRKYNVFDFIRDPWSNNFILSPIVSLKPKPAQLSKTRSELGFLLI